MEQDAKEDPRPGAALDQWLSRKREESYPVFVLSSLLTLRAWYALARNLHLVGLAAALSVASGIARPGAALVPVVGALAAYALFGLSSNDLFDEALDRRARHARPIHGLPDWLKWFLVVAPIPLGLWWASAAGMSPLLYGLGLTAALAYVAPGIRLKGRGSAGFASCLLGSHVVPAILLIEAFPGSPDLAATFVLASCAVGATELLTHQIRTHERDLRAGDLTWVARRGLPAARRARAVLASVRSAAALAVAILVVLREPGAVIPLSAVLLANVPAGTADGFPLLALPDAARRLRSFRLTRFLSRVPLKEVSFAIMLWLGRREGTLLLLLAVSVLADRQWLAARLAHVRWLLRRRRAQIEVS